MHQKLHIHWFDSGVKLVQVLLSGTDCRSKSGQVRTPETQTTVSAIYEPEPAYIRFLLRMETLSCGGKYSTYLTESLDSNWRLKMLKQNYSLVMWLNLNILSCSTIIDYNRHVIIGSSQIYQYCHSCWLKSKKLLYRKANWWYELTHSSYLMKSIYLITTSSFKTT